MRDHCKGRSETAEIGYLGAASQPLSYPFNEIDSLEVSDQYQRLRRSRTLPKVRLPFGDPAWLVIDYELARFVLGDPRFSSAAMPGRDVPRQSDFPKDPGLLALDKPDHVRLRALIASSFARRRTEDLRPQVRAHAEILIEEMKSIGPPTDLVEDYALPLTLKVISDVLGVPNPDRARLRHWSDAQLTTNTLPAQETAQRSKQLDRYMAELIAARQTDPRDDLLTDLIKAKEETRRLSEAELIKVTRELVFAGYEATSNQIANFTNFLLREPGLWNSLRIHPERLEATVEELLRFVPVMAGAGSMPRYALQDVMVGETTVAAGDAVLVSLGASNRDSHEFPDPETFHTDRDRNRHLAFGHGAHHCVGMPLARVELQESLAALTCAFPDLHLAGDIVWKKQVMRGPRRMLVGW